MTEPTIHRVRGAATVLGILSTTYAATFLFGALLHLGVRVPLGSAVLAEPRKIPATVGEFEAGPLAGGGFRLRVGLPVGGEEGGRR